MLLLVMHGSGSSMAHADAGCALAAPLPHPSAPQALIRSTVFAPRLSAALVAQIKKSWGPSHDSKQLFSSSHRVGVLRTSGIRHQEVDTSTTQWPALNTTAHNTWDQILLTHKKRSLDRSNQIVPPASRVPNAIDYIFICTLPFSALFNVLFVYSL